MGRLKHDGREKGPADHGHSMKRGVGNHLLYQKTFESRDYSAASWKINENARVIRVNPGFARQLLVGVTRQGKTFIK